MLRRAVTGGAADDVKGDGCVAMAEERRLERTQLMPTSAQPTQPTTDLAVEFSNATTPASRTFRVLSCAPLCSAVEHIFRWRAGVVAQRTGGALERSAGTISLLSEGAALDLRRTPRELGLADAAIARLVLRVLP